MTNKKKIPDYWEKACIELSSKDHSIGQIINKYREPILSSKGDVFFTLIRSIVGQQISVKAADSVWKKLEELCNGVWREKVGRRRKIKKRPLTGRWDPVDVVVKTGDDDDACGGDEEAV